MAGITGDAERAVEPLDVILVVGASQLQSRVCRGCSPAGEISKVRPDVRRRKGVLHRVEIDVFLPLVRSRRKQMWEGQKHRGDVVGALAADARIDALL